jgi:glycosyltransferase involved in cell wall biosynthesis
VFGVVARLVPIKGVHIVVRAVAQLCKEGRVELKIFGDGPQRLMLENQIAELGLRDVVQLYGWIDDVTDALAEVDCLVLASTSEGTPRCILEAASVAVPAIATAVGSTPDIIQDGVTGWLVPAGDEDALTQAMRRVVFDPKSLPIAGERALAWVRTRMSPEQEACTILKG